MSEEEIKWLALESNPDILNIVYIFLNKFFKEKKIFSI